MLQLSRHDLSKRMEVQAQREPAASEPEEEPAPEPEKALAAEKVDSPVAALALRLIE